MSTHTEVDVIVLGAGAAGLATALTTAAAGLETLVIETSTPQRHTPNVRMSGGWVMTVDDVVDGSRYLEASAGGLVDAARVVEWARQAAGLADWLGSFGIELRADGEHRLPEHPQLAGGHSIRIRRAHTTVAAPIASQPSSAGQHDASVGGEALYRGLMSATMAADIALEWDTKVDSLVRESGGRVTGVHINASNRSMLARRGVVIATGGFGASQELIRNHFAVPDTRFYGNPNNDGSGLRLGASVGAQLARMNRLAGRGIGSFTTEDGQQLGFAINMAPGAYVVCDKLGRRYADELPQAELYHDVAYTMEVWDSASDDFSRSPSYYLFDQSRIDHFERRSP